MMYDSAVIKVKMEMEEEEEMMLPLDDDGAVPCSGNETACEAAQDNTIAPEMENANNGTAEEHLDVAQPTIQPASNRKRAKKGVGLRKRKKILKRKLKKGKSKVKRDTEVPPVEYGSLNYPDDNSDDDQQSKIYFKDVPQLYSKLLKWNPDTPAPRSLKAWRNSLNVEFAADRFLSPVYRFFRIFLNRQLGGRKYKMVRIQRYCSRSKRVSQRQEAIAECATPAVQQQV